jgi:hypothetical protein
MVLRRVSRRFAPRRSNSCHSGAKCSLSSGLPSNARLT